MAILTFDAAASNIDGSDPGSPLNVGPGFPLRLREASFPAPPASIQYAGSVDTDGSLVASRKHENRQITLTIMCDTPAALRSLQSKIGKIFSEGGTLKVTFPNDEVIIFDPLAADAFEPKIDVTYWKNGGAYCDVEVTLPAAPYGRGLEQDMGDNIETTLPMLVFTDTGVKGDVPGLGRLVIDNDVAASQAFAWWGVRSHYYSSASTAALFYEAESCAMIGAAAAVGAAGASGAGSNVARHANVGTSGIYNGLVYIGASSTAQTHIGSYRVFARVYAPSANTGTISVRAAWRRYVGAPTIYNDAVTLLDPSNTAIEDKWVMLDLGQVRLPAAKVGTQGWIGWLEGTSTTATDDLDVDWIMLIPIDESSGQVIAPSDADPPITASQSMSVRHDGVFASRTGGYWLEPTLEGDNLLIPPAGLEGRTLQVIVKLARGIGTVATNNWLEPPVAGDPNADDLSARLFYTPRYLVVPSP